MKALKKAKTSYKDKKKRQNTQIRASIIDSAEESDDEKMKINVDDESP